MKYLLLDLLSTTPCSPSASSASATTTTGLEIERPVFFDYLLKPSDYFSCVGWRMPLRMKRIYGSQYSYTLHFLVISIGAFPCCFMVCAVKWGVKGVYYLYTLWLRQLFSAISFAENFSPCLSLQISSKKYAFGRDWILAILEFAMNNGLSYWSIETVEQDGDLFKINCWPPLNHQTNKTFALMLKEIRN